MSKTYISIDLKSFYASVECMERGLDPLNTNLVVADASRTQKTICLAVSPSLKAYGIPGRARLFEVEQKVKEANARRQTRAPKNILDGKSVFATELNENPCLAIDYIAAKPRMALYMSKSTQIYDVYLRYIAPKDIYAYSVDEVFIDASGYLKPYGLNAHDFARLLVREVFKETGITATAGIGPNLYLCKIAMDIGAKHTEADADGVRIAELDEYSYRRLLWDHRPITDFWRVGRGYAKKLAKKSIFTMGDIARCSLGTSSDYYNEDLLYKMFGVNAELLIDHAFGYETCKIEDIKAFHSKSNSLHSGQVLPSPYGFTEGRMVAEEMAEDLALDLLKKGKDSAFVQLYLSFDEENAGESYEGNLVQNHYGKRVPKSVHGLYHFPKRSNQGRAFREAVLAIYDRIMDRRLRIRKLSISAEDVRDCEALPEGQLDLFQHFLTSDEEEKECVEKKQFLEKEEKARGAALEVMEKFGKNALLKGYQYLEGARGRERNRQIGGHNSGVSDLVSIRRKEESTIAKNIVEGQDYER